jgi:hypothetical protein
MIAASAGLNQAGVQAAVYYVAPDGDDTRDGLAPERAWRSLERVNKAQLAAGDQVLFRRGGQWRGQLLPQSGTESGAITYGAYGEGLKPSLVGSVAMNREADWKPAGPNRWTTNSLQPTDRQLLDAALLKRLALHCEQGAAAQGRWSGTEYTLRCQQPGTASNHIQLYLAPFSIEAHRTYQLRFRAKANQAVQLAAPALMSAGPPWRAYSVARNPATFAIGPDWVVCTHLYQAAETAKDARLTFGLGGRLAAGAELAIADLTLVECVGTDLLPCDVGNIIFDHGRAWGVKKWDSADLLAERDYWYDRQAHRVELFLEENPARRFKSIELALREHIILQSGRSYVTYENLDVRYGAAHGIGGGSTHHIVVRDCDFSWIGGGHQFTRPDGVPVRFGNGVEFWGSAHDCVVERCRLWEIYDAALTNQNSGAVAQQYNLVYRHNLIWNCEYSFEYWNAPEASQTHHVYFEHNTCYGAGHGWGHSQRPDPAGRHLCFYTNRAQTHDLYIRNNIFCHATNVAFDALWWKPETVAERQVICLDHNCWRQPGGTMIRFKGRSYTQVEFADYQRATGQETHSLAADPALIDPGRLDFHLRGGSPCIDAGATLGYTNDFEGRAIPQGRAPDIGAYETPGPK